MLNANERLNQLKRNVERLSSATDDFLLHLLGQAERRLAIMGVTDDGSGDFDDVLIDYAAYHFRKRDKDESESGMPVFLRREIHDLKLHQQAAAAGVSE